MSNKKQIKLPKVAQYVKNVGKSLALISIDSVKDFAPSTTDFIESNDEYIKKSFSYVKNVRQNMGKAGSDINKGRVFQAVESGFKNLKADIASGNFYNTARINQAQEDMFMASMGFDDDDDFDFSFDDDDDYEDNQTKSITDSFNKAIGAAASSNNNAVTGATELMFKANKASTQVLVANMDKIGAHINAGLGSIYSNIGITNKFLETHIANSNSFYENISKSLNEQVAMTKELLEMQRNLYKGVSNSSHYSGSNKSRMSQSMNYDGSINLEGYVKNIVSNFKNYDMFGVLDGGGDKDDMLNPMNIVMNYLANPLVPILGGLGKGLMPKKLKKSIKTFDKGFSSAFSQIITSVNRHKDDDGIIGILANIFGASLDKKSKIDPSKFNKGAIPFDGVTKQAIIETIPGYLSRIEAALTGANERHYNYDTGKWTNINNINRDYKQSVQSTIARANYSIKNDTDQYLRELAAIDPKAAKSLEKSIFKMMTKIYEDDGYFRKDRVKGPGGVSVEAWKYYGFKNKQSFDRLFGPGSGRNSIITEDTLRELAARNISAKQGFSSSRKNEEAKAYSVERQLVNDAYSLDISGSSKNKSFKYNTGLLSLSYDKDGHNVFWYLKNILNRLGHNTNANGAYNNRSNTRRVSVRKKSRSKSSSSSNSDDGDDPDADSDDDYTVDESIYKLLEEEEQKRLQERDSNTKNKDKLGDKFRSILEKSSFGRFLNSSSSFIGKMFEAPVNAVTNLLNKTNDNLMKFVFGDTKDRPILRDADGNEIEGLLPYMVEKVRQTFIKVTKDIKDWMKRVLHLDTVKEYVKDKWNTYGKPIIDESASTLKRGYKRVREGLDNTLGNGFRKISASLKNKSVINSNDIKNGNISDDGTNPIQNSARGRIVTKRGLTMISPGEIIIPRSFDKKEQQKDLIDEKKEKKRILDSLIDYNASGTINVDKDVKQMKETLKKLMQESKGKSSKLGSGALLGAGAGLITGFGPIIGAAAGAGLSLLSYSETAKRIILGSEIVDNNGNVYRDGGIISKKIQDKFKKYANDSLDFGIAGGVLGLVTGMGPLTGSAIGAGVGLLKNSESFKKFIFGDEMNPNDNGIIDRESFNKFKAFAKKSAPNIAIGAAAGILTGPFGILGNSVIGSGLGLLTATDTFKKFVFGDKDDPNSEGLAGVFKNSVINPMKDNMKDIMEKFKKFADKHILSPLKDFWNPFKQMIKNMISNVGDSIVEITRNSLEKMLGTPAMEFLRERLLKPISKVALGALSIPAGIVGGIGLGGIRLLGGIGNNIRMRQINKGTAYDMSAADRLAFRNKHSLRNKMKIFGKDRSLEQDEYFANMSLDDLKELRDTASTYTSTRKDIENAKLRAKMSVQNKMSKFVNTRNSDGKNLYDLLSPSDVNKITKYITQGDAESFSKIMSKPKIIKALGPSMHGKLLDEGNKYIENIAGLEGSLKAFDKSQGERDETLKSILGDKFKLKGKRNMKHLRKLAEAELKARGGINPDSEEFDLDNMETVESKATDRLTDLVNESSTKLFTILSETNEYLKNILGKDDASNKGTPADRTSNVAADIIKNDTNVANDLDTPTSAKAGVKRVISGVKTPKEGEVREEFIPSAGKYAKFIVKNDKLVESDDSETQEALAVVDKSMALQEQTAENTKSTGGIMSFMKEKLFGKKDKEKDEGLLGGIGSKLGKIGKVLGVGMVAAPLLVPMGKWFVNKALPAIKTLLFGKKDENSIYGYSSTGLLGGLYTSFRRVILGDSETGEKGLVGKFLDWMSDTKKGFPAILRKTIPYVVNGLGYVFNNLITPMTAAFIHHLPQIAIGLGKGILKGITSWFKGKEIQDDDAIFMGLENDQSYKNITNYGSTINNNLKSDVDPEITKHFANTLSISHTNRYTSNPNIPNNTVDDIKNTEDIYERSFGIKGLLGERKNTNQLVYINGEPHQADGTGYDQFNTHSSIGSHLYEVAQRGFLEGVAGNAGSGLLRHYANKDISKVGRFGLLKFPRKAIAFAKKYMSKAALASNTLGGKIHKIITGEDVLDKSEGFVKRYLKNKFDVDNFGEIASKVAPKTSDLFSKTKDKLLKFGKKKTEDVAETAIKQSTEGFAKSAIKGVIKQGKEKIADSTIVSSFKSLFRNLLDSGIGKHILKVAKGYNKIISKETLTNAFEKMAEKLAKKGASKLAQNSIKTIAKAIANFSIIGLVFIVTDFITGYNDAETYLGVPKGSENVNFVHKIICGLINVLTEKFTFGLIPTSLIIDIFGEVLFPLFGMDMDAIEKEKASVDSIMDQWNIENPKYAVDNLEDYNEVQTWWGRRKRDFKNAFKSKKKIDKSAIPESSRLYANGRNNIRSGKNSAINNSYLYGGSRNTVSKNIGHIYQSDSSISKIGYGDSTIGDAGCAPVAATNLINRYYGNASLYNAAKFAEVNGMTVPGGGTTMDYFNSYLNSNGIGTATTNNKNAITNALKNGNQVVMLGQDNTDKPGAPFGTNPHYVTAVGLDRNGNIIAEDPDLPNRSIVYNKNKVLNSMINSVVTANPNTPSGRARMVARHKVINYGRSRKGKLCNADVVLAIARNEIGVKEGPSPNQVKYNYAFYNSNSAYGENYAWCAVFLWWVFHQAGAAKLFCGGDAVAYVPDITNYYRSIGRFDKKNPKPGDLIIVGDEAHVAMVDSIIDDHTVRTVEGNWDDQVTTRGLSYNDIFGFCHIDYPYEYDPSCIIDMSKYNGGDNTDYSKFVNANSSSSSAVETPKQETIFDKISKVSTGILKGMYGENAYNALFGTEPTNTNTEEGVNCDPAVSNGKPLKGANSAEKIWNYLRTRGYTPAGAAGLMGNLKAESGLRTDNVQDSYEGTYGDDETYTNAVNSRNKSKSSFSNDEVGYGLAQWTYNSRKAGLYDHTVANGKKINDLEGQVSYLIKELEQDYPGVNNVLKSTNSVEDASDKVLTDFERPAVPNYSERRSYSNEFYSKYSNSAINPSMNYMDSVSTSTNGMTNTTNYAMGRKNNSVKYGGGATKALRSNIIYANDTHAISGTSHNSISKSSTHAVDYVTFLQTIITVLIKISDNTALLSSILEILSKNLNLNISKSDIDKAKSSGRAEAASALNSIINRSGGVSNVSSVLNNQDNKYILEAMAALAKE